MSKILLLLVICCGSAYCGLVVFGHIPVANWILGATTGLVSMAIILED